MTAELKSCPFCGRAPEKTENGEYCPDYRAGVTCGCGASVFQQYQSDGIEVWNTRAEPAEAERDALRARVAELSALLGRAVNGPWLGSDLDSARAALSRENGE